MSSEQSHGWLCARASVRRDAATADRPRTQALAGRAVPPKTHRQACAPARRCAMLAPTETDHTEGIPMAKGLDKKKEQKKKPAKTLKEKRAEKNEKKTTKGFTPT